MDGWLICILYMFYMIRIVNQNNWYISLPSIIEQNTNDALSLSADPNYGTKFSKTTNVSLI